MGILDDAIRDHLDLKRRRGADPGEVERAEREALGPVRRNPTPAELAEAEAAADAGPTSPEADGATNLDADGAFAYDQAGDDSWSHDSLPEPAAESTVAPVYDDSPAPPVQPAPEFDEPPFEEEPAPEPVLEERQPGAPAIGGVSPETAEYNVEDVLAAENEAEDDDGEDVLEETPEFLQDTPDHDRLWFEQRPPKDFDFDE
jgi:hypothetical protein